MEAAWFRDFWSRVQRGEPAAVGILAGGVILVILLVWLLAFRPGAAVPDIPEEISRGRGVEPRLRVYFHTVGRVREMDLEDYLLGVVAAEMDPSWPLEALKAQAVLARTFTLNRVDEFGEVPGRDAHASTNPEEFQAYDSSRINQQVQQAVAQTRGQVVVNRGRFVRAWFHAYSGGHTTTPQSGLDWKQGGTPYIVPVDDSELDAAIPAEIKFWATRLSDDEVRAAVRKVAGRDPGPVQRLEVTSWSDDGRALTLRVNDVEVSAVAFRLAVGSTDFRSTMIQEIERDGDGFLIRGKGFGHGVGMSQWGARVLAERGTSAEDIIRRYYKDVQIVRLWE